MWIFLKAPSGMTVFISYFWFLKRTSISDGENRWNFLNATPAPTSNQSKKSRILLDKELMRFEIFRFCLSSFTVSPVPLLLWSHWGAEPTAISFCDEDCSVTWSWDSHPFWIMGVDSLHPSWGKDSKPKYNNLPNSISPGPHRLPLTAQIYFSTLGRLGINISPRKGIMWHPFSPIPSTLLVL